jgi:hypothetical protein
VGGEQVSGFSYQLGHVFTTYKACLLAAQKLIQGQEGKGKGF